MQALKALSVLICGGRRPLWILRGIFATFLGIYAKIEFVNFQIVQGEV